ncbi:MAG: hypothetical protein R3B60_00955 [Candidatus Paceibacterota bacterium]
MNLYKIVFKNIHEIVNELDPVNLIGGGAPGDEYYDEVIKIVSLLKEDNEKVIFTEKLTGIFIESFGCNTEFKNDIFLLLSDRVLELKERLKW